MRRFAVLVIALVLAPNLNAAGISTFPNFILPEVRPEIEVVPETRPEILPEVEAVVPELITINPCDACFEYMTTLIDQLTQVGVETPIHPELPEVALPESEPEVPEIGLPAPEVPVNPEIELPEVENIRPLPESVPEDLRPLPVPEQPEIEVNPIPIPIIPEAVVRPLPELIVSSEALEDY